MRRPPRSTLELLIYSVVPLAVLFSSAELIDMDTLAVFGLSALRIIPIFNKVVQSINSLSYGRASSNSIKTTFGMPIREVQTKTKKLGKNLFSLQNVSKFYNEQVIFDNQNLFIPLRHTLISGPSGSGKSTLLRMMLGIETPDAGNVFISDSINKKDIMYTPQKAYLPPGSLTENFEIQDPEKFIEIARSLCLDKVKKSDLVLNTLEYDKLFSGGELQRLKIAGALYRMPRILVLDEAINAIDNDLKKMVLKVVLATIEVVVLISHDPEDKSFFDEIINL